ncbi:MAG TPA: hypothetical protein VK618_04755 [Flavitalea sp.]|nr:hypothetical protein [Flavitalea sp.]
MDRITTLKDYLKASPADSFLQHALALEYIKKDDDLTARHLFEEILQRDPGYIGSYYHLGKLLERSGERMLAAQWYQQGMEKAMAAGDRHALNELRGAWEELNDNES